MGETEKEDPTLPKELDQVAMIKRLKINQTIAQFCINDLKQKRAFSENTFLLMFNFSFLVKLSMMHMILVSIPLMPKVGLFLLCGIEGGYVIMTLYQYIKSNHLKSFLLLIPKLAQSLFLLVIEAYILKSFWDLEEPKLPIPVHN